MPLYMHSALLIIRNMGVDVFNYPSFLMLIQAPDQRPWLEPEPNAMAMIKLHFGLLDASLRPEVPDTQSYFCAGKLVLVDLTDAFLAHDTRNRTKSGVE